MGQDLGYQNTYMHSVKAQLVNQICTSSKPKANEVKMTLPGLPVSCVPAVMAHKWISNSCLINSRFG